MPYTNVAFCVNNALIYQQHFDLVSSKREALWAHKTPLPSTNHGTLSMGVDYWATVGNDVEFFRHFILPALLLSLYASTSWYVTVPHHIVIVIAFWIPSSLATFVASLSHRHFHHAHITLIFFATSVVVAVSCVKIIAIVKHHHIAADSSPCLDAITAGVIFSFQVAEMRRYFYVLNLASSGRMIESLQELGWQNHLPRVTTGIVAMLVAWRRVLFRGKRQRIFSCRNKELMGKRRRRDFWDWPQLDTIQAIPETRYMRYVIVLKTILAPFGVPY